MPTFLVGAVVGSLLTLALEVWVVVKLWRRGVLAKHFLDGVVRGLERGPSPPPTRPAKTFDRTGN